MAFEVGAPNSGARRNRYKRREDSGMAFNPGDKPHDLDVERATLAGILLTNEILLDIQGRLKSEHFFLPAHREIYDACNKLAFQNQPIDLQTLAGYLRDNGKLEMVGGAEYLSELALTPSTSHHTKEYSKMVYDLAWRRRIQEAGILCAEAALRAGDTRSIASEVEQAVFNATQEVKSSAVTKIGDLVPDLITELEKRADNGGESDDRVHTGLRDLDKRLSGLRPGQLVVLAARPGMGKTSLAANIMFDIAAHQEKPVIFFSLEMTKEEITERIMSFVSGIDSSKLRNGNLSPDDFQSLFQAADEFSTAPLYVDDRSILNPYDVLAEARRIQSSLRMKDANQSLGLIVVDYIQIMKSGIHSENRSLEVAAITGGLKAIAKDLRVPVLALSQLNREGAKRGSGESKKPQLSDLRDSGAIEADADVVLFIHREQNEEHDSRAPAEAEIIVAKQRSGPTGGVKVTWLGHMTRFTDYIDTAHTPEPYGIPEAYDNYPPSQGAESSKNDDQF